MLKKKYFFLLGAKLLRFQLVDCNTLAIVIVLCGYYIENLNPNNMLSYVWSAHSETSTMASIYLAKRVHALGSLCDIYDFGILIFII